MREVAVRAAKPRNPVPARNRGANCRSLRAGHRPPRPLWLSDFAPHPSKTVIRVALCGEGADELFAGYGPLEHAFAQGNALGRHVQEQCLSMMHRANLQRVDRCSMRFELEIREPFLDLALVEYACGPGRHRAAEDCRRPAPRQAAAAGALRSLSRRPARRRSATAARSISTKAPASLRKARAGQPCSRRPSATGNSRTAKANSPPSKSPARKNFSTCARWPAAWT